MQFVFSVGSSSIDDIKSGKISSNESIEKNNVNNSYKDKAVFSWTNTVSGENIIQIQNTGKSEFNVGGTVELSRDPLFFTYHILVIIAGIVVIGFSAAFSAKKPRGF